MQGKEAYGKTGGTSAKIGKTFARIAETSERIGETSAKTAGNSGTIYNPAQVLGRFRKIAMTSAKTGAIFGMIAGISGTTGTIGATTADSYGMVWVVGTEAKDGKPLSKHRAGRNLGDCRLLFSCVLPSTSFLYSSGSHRTRSPWGRYPPDSLSDFPASARCKLKQRPHSFSPTYTH